MAAHINRDFEFGSSGVFVGILPVEHLEFGFNKVAVWACQMLRAITTEVVISFEWVSERVHFFMTTPAIFTFDDREALADCFVMPLGELRLSCNGKFGDIVSQKVSEDPFAATDRVGVEIGAVSDKPGRVGEDAGSLVCGHFKGGGTACFPVAFGHIVGELIPKRLGRFFRLSF